MQAVRNHAGGAAIEALLIVTFVTVAVVVAAYMNLADVERAFGTVITDLAHWFGFSIA
jgi:Flp pilus assembly pilin Flp